MGTTAHSKLARMRVQEFCNRQPRGSCLLEILDLLEHGDLAERERIIATPLLRRVEPGPTVSLVGDMGDDAQLAALLVTGEESGRVM